eukprot:7515849-Heterocapsa_arctica.AAC.1
MALEERMALHNAAAEQTERRLGAQNDQYVKGIASLSDIVRQSVGDREDERIKTLTDSISTAMEIDTEDVE